MEERGRQRQFEDSFHRQLESKARDFVRTGGVADKLTVEEVPDGADAVRAVLGRLRVYDREALNTLPGTRAVAMRFEKRIFGPFTKTMSRVRAQVLAPMDKLVRGETPGPVGREEILDALARYEQLPRGLRPTGVIFASATGFTAEARLMVQRGGLPSLILVGGRPDGGWDIDLPENVKKSPWARLFEFESHDERLKRLIYHLEKNADTLDARGLSVAELATVLGLPREQTEQLMRKATRQDSRLVTFAEDGQVFLTRSPLAEEASTMGMWASIRKMLGMKPSVAERVKQMTTQRVQIERQRHEVDQRVNALEADERDLLQRGVAATIDVEKKQLAGKLMRVRRDLKRLRSEEAVYSKQIDILGTQIHHLTLTERGKRVDLPSAEDLTREAAQAEQMMNELSANADLVSRIEINAQSPLQAAEEADILKEFEQIAAAGQAAERGNEAAKTSGSAARASEPPAKQGAAPVRSPAAIPPLPGNEDKSRARPEVS